jgi:hypothetical protein
MDFVHELAHSRLLHATALHDLYHKSTRMRVAVTLKSGFELSSVKPTDTTFVSLGFGGVK